MTQIDGAPTTGTAPGPDAATAAADRVSIRRVVIGAVLGFLATYALIVTMCWRIGIALGAAAGLGVFVAIFGGAGFGAMMGGAMKSDPEA